MNRRLIFAVVITALLVNLAIGAQIYLAAQGGPSKGSSDVEDPNVQLFSDVLEKVRAEYVDGKDITYQQLVYSSLKGMVKKLDPHSEFLDAESYQRLQDDTQGQFGGLGLVVSMKGGYVTVVSPMDDTPGARAGILAGDRIIKVAGKIVDKMSLDDVVKELRGEPNTEIGLTIQRPSTGESRDYTLKRAIIQMAMVKDINGKKDYPLDENKIGYIRIVQFGDQTSDELEDALQKLKEQGMRGLILDLRENPGGLLDEAVGVCQKFLPRNQLVVSTEGRDTLEKYYAKGDGDELKGEPIVVLVNLGSASAAEIVTGCLQDLHRAVVLGEKTFGKGSVQTIFPLRDGSALKLTVAKYYTPSHKVIHEHGITPDIFVPLTDAEEAALLLKRSPGGLAALGDTERASFEKLHDVQMERAEDLLKGMLIYETMDVSQPQKVAVK
jgi:carboxyl-terminal processing protease